MSRQTGFQLCVLLLIVCGTAVPGGDVLAQDDGKELDSILAVERWREMSVGLSLRPPLGAKLAHLTGEKAAVRMTHKRGYIIEVYVKKSKEKLNIKQLEKFAIHQISYTTPSAKVADEKRLTVGGKQAILHYFGMPGKTKRHKPWILGQLMVLVGPQSVVGVRLEIPPNDYEGVRSIFETMIKSVRFDDPKTLVEQRKRQTANAEAWHKTVTAEKRRAALIPQQWMRVLENGRDVGWMLIAEGNIDEKEAKRLRATSGSALDSAGVFVRVQARVLFQSRALDSLSELYLSDDGEQELWRIKTTIRPLTKNDVRPGGVAVRDPEKKKKSKFELPKVFQALEIGVRNDAEIIITRQTPDGVKNHQWERPSGRRGYYVSQVDLHLLGRLVPQKSQEMGFYAYYPNDGRLSFRAERIVAEPGGSVSVFSRPTLDHGEQESRFDRTGRMLRRTLPTGQQVVPTTRSQLASIWRIKLPAEQSDRRNR